MKLKIRKFSEIEWESGLASQLVSIFIIFAAFIMYLWCLETCHTYICAAKTQTKLDSLIDGMAVTSLEVSAMETNNITQSGNKSIQYFNAKKVENYLLNYQKIIKDLTNSAYDVDFEFSGDKFAFNNDGTVKSDSITNYSLSVNETNAFGDMKFDFDFAGINTYYKIGNNATINGSVENTFEKIVFSGRVRFRGKAKIETNVDMVSSMNDTLSYPDDIKKDITPFTALDTSGVNNYDLGLNRLVTVINQLNVMNRKRYSKPVNKIMVPTESALNKSAYFIRDVVSAYVGNSDSGNPNIFNSSNGGYVREDGEDYRSVDFIDFLNEIVKGSNYIYDKDYYNDYYSDLKLVYDGIDNNGILTYNEILQNLNNYVVKGLLVVGYVEDYSNDNLHFENQYFVVTPTISTSSEGFKSFHTVDFQKKDETIQYAKYFVDTSKLTSSDNISITYAGNDIAENEIWFAGENGENVHVEAEILKNAKIYIINYDKLFNS